MKTIINKHRAGETVGYMNAKLDKLKNTIKMTLMYNGEYYVGILTHCKG